MNAQITIFDIIDRPKRHTKPVTKFEVGSRKIEVSGRNAQTLKELIKAGERGLTSLEFPALRLAAYVHDLRTEYGIEIERIDEKHGGQFSGTHARYKLKSTVKELTEC